MDRASAIAKIQAMLRLQEGTSFDGEASNAARMIDRLCKQYGLSVEEASQPQINDEQFCQFGRINQAHFRIIVGVARFYDAEAYATRKSFRVIGSEAQQIVTKIYFDFIVECMEAECNKAYQAEKILADLMGNPDPGRTFKHQFRLAFSQQVRERLAIMKREENRVHEHKQYALAKIRTYQFSSRTIAVGAGEGAAAGACAGQSVSLHRQATGSRTLQLTGS